ncbi:MAG: alpha/beta fold hydrolase [Deltaproteobacteria bacterium]|nr:alpha/beta fold hydrolase [Deltaproteobacteria bacterium]
MTIIINPRPLHGRPAIRTPQLLFLHGWATDSSIWQHQIEELSKDYEVIAIDLPGHSEKDRWDEPTLQPAIEKVINKISDFKSAIRNPQSAYIVAVGWSLGGQAILEMAASAPDLFKAVILVASSPCLVARKDFPWGQPPGVAKRMLKDVKKDFINAMKRFYPLNFTPEELATADAQRFLKHSTNMASAFDPGSMAKSLEALLSFDIRKHLGRIKTPALILQGSKDSVCHPGAATYLAKNIGNAKTEIVKGAGHIPFLTRRKEFNNSIKGFIETL